MKKATHSLFYAVVASAILLPVLASQHEHLAANQVRALADPTTAAVTGGDPSANPSTSTPPSTSASPSAAATSTTPSAAASNTHSSSSSPPTAATSHATSAAASAGTGTSVGTTTTDSAGNLFTTTVLATPATTSQPPSHADDPNSSGGGGLSTGSIIGLSVAGGVAALGIILFFVWKLTRKRFSDFDDSEAIKWPELNAHNNDLHALPTNATGRAGFGPENDSDINLTRAPSPGGAYANSITNSVPDAYGAGDPYAVPPLPHLNPNQPYRDDPGAYGQPAGYYDPYRGPAPNTFDTIDNHGTEAIPMTRMRSPGPQVAYDMQGRGSPVPQAAMGYPGIDERSRTPNPSVLGAGRASPSPYGYGPR